MAAIKRAMDHLSVFPSRKIIILTTLLAAVSVPQVCGFNIELDYGYDTGSDNFFGSNATAKAAVEQAAADISALLTTELAPVSSSYSGTNGATTATFNWSYLFKNPSTGADVTLSTPSLSANTVQIFVGMRELLGFDRGSGVPAGAQYQLSGGGYGSEWTGALAIAEAKSHNGIGRGGGPVILNFSDVAAFDGTTASYNVDLGVGVGSIWFDIDSDDSGTSNSNSELNDYWHYDHTTAVDVGKYDLYSVAIHEILHALGIGVSNTWDDQVSGLTNWTGSEVISVHGSGAGLIHSTTGHINYGVMSTKLSDGTIQQAAMTPSLGKGERREMTELDAAFFIDIGYTTVPEPSSLLLLSSFSVMLLLRRNK